VSAPFFVSSKIGTAESKNEAGPVVLIIFRGIVLEEGDSAFFLRPPPQAGASFGISEGATCKFTGTFVGKGVKR